MTTITIDDKKLSTKYSAWELEMKISQFLEDEFWAEKLDVFSIDSSSLSKNSQERLQKIDSLEFSDY